MKILALLLLLVNLVFYAFSAGYLGEPSSPEAGRLAQQVQPEKIVIVGHGDSTPPPAKTASKEEPVSKTDEAGSGEAAKPEEVKPEPAKAEPAKTEPAKVEEKKPALPAEEPARSESKPAAEVAMTCRAWDKVALADAEKLSVATSAKFADYQWTRKASGGNDGAAWWVYIPTLADKAEADKKASELRLFGVGDFFIVQDGPNRNAISLGIFSLEKGAQERLTELKGRGVRSARIGMRPGKEGYFLIEAYGPESGMAKLTSAVGKVLPKAQAQPCQ